MRRVHRSRDRADRGHADVVKPEIVGAAEVAAGIEVPRRARQALQLTLDVGGGSAR